MYSRRAALKGVVGVVGVAVAMESANAAPRTAPDTSTRTNTNLGPASSLALFSELPALGDTFVRYVGEELAGAVPLVLHGPHGYFQVDVCKADLSGRRGVAQSRSLDLFVHNGGRGDVATSTEHIVALRKLAAELERRERTGVNAPPLLNWTERQRLIRGDDYTVDVLSAYLAER
jgi:hypothetical protein